MIQYSIQTASQFITVIQLSYIIKWFSSTSVKHCLNLNHGSLYSLGLKRVGEKSCLLHNTTLWSERMLHTITTSRYSSLLCAIIPGNWTSCTAMSWMPNGVFRFGFHQGHICGSVYSCIIDYKQTAELCTQKIKVHYEYISRTVTYCTVLWDCMKQYTENSSLWCWTNSENCELYHEQGVALDTTRCRHGNSKARAVRLRHC